MMTMGFITAIKRMFSGAGKSQLNELPIQGPDSIDIVAKRRDGGADLFVVASGHLATHPDVKDMLQKKVWTYINYALTSEFREEYGLDVSDPIAIMISCVATPDREVLEVIEELASHAKGHGIELGWEVYESHGRRKA